MAFCAHGLWGLAGGKRGSDDLRSMYMLVKNEIIVQLYRLGRGRELFRESYRLLDRTGKEEACHNGIVNDLSAERGGLSR